MEALTSSPSASLSNVNAVGVLAVPPAWTMLMNPVVASAGTVAVICSSDSAVKGKDGVDAVETDRRSAKQTLASQDNFLEMAAMIKKAPITKAGPGIHQNGKFPSFK